MECSLGKMLGIGMEQLQIGERNIQTARQHYRRIDRFIRPGVDVVMEKKGMATISKAKKGYGRVAYFLASRVQKETVTISNPVNSHKYFKHVDCFTSSGVEKGEGYLGGGQVTSFKRIGFNPYGKLREPRVKRQHSHTDTKKKQGNFCRKPPPTLDKKTSAEILHMKRECEEASAALKANEEQKAMQKQERANEMKKDYEDIMGYNPWGQPAAGAPKLTKSGKIRTQLYGIKSAINDEQKYDLFGLQRKYAHGVSMGRSYRRKQDNLGKHLSEFEKKKLLEEQERQYYYVNYLDKQRSKEQQRLENKEKCVPTDFICGRKDVERNVSGKLVPRKRQLYTLDHGPIFNQSYQTYFSIADKMLRIPGHFPFRGEVDYSYSKWNSPGANSLMRSRGGQIRPPPLETSPPSSDMNISPEVDIKLPPPEVKTSPPALSGTDRRLSQPETRLPSQTNIEPPLHATHRRLSLPVSTLSPEINTRPLAPPANIGPPPADTSSPKQPNNMQLTGHVTGCDVGGDGASQRGSNGREVVVCPPIMTSGVTPEGANVGGGDNSMQSREAIEQVRTDNE